jgi:hypothetical protein
MLSHGCRDSDIYACATKTKNKGGSHYQHTTGVLDVKSLLDKKYSQQLAAFAVQFRQRPTDDWRLYYLAYERFTLDRPRWTG